MIDKHFLRTFQSRFNKFLRHFDELFWCNFDGWKFDGVSTCFVLPNFDGQKISTILMQHFNVCLTGKNFTPFRCTILMQFRWMETKNGLNSDRFIWMCFWKKRRSFWYLFLINFRLFENENGSEHLLYLISDLSWSAYNHRVLS